MNNLLMWLFVLLPILNIYRIPFGPDIQLGYALVILFVIKFILDGKGFVHKLPKVFYFYWAYIGVDYFFLTINNFKFSNLIPGGFQFFIWTITLMMMIKHLDYNKFLSYYKISFVVCGCVLLLQEFSYFVLGSRPLFLLPLQLSGESMNDYLISAQMSLNRSSAFFREPAQFAQYALPLFALEMNRSSNKFLSNYCYFIILILLFLRSGNGFLGLIILLLYRIIQYSKYTSNVKVIAKFLMLIPLVLLLLSYFLKTEGGVEIIERVSKLGLDPDAESFDRLFRGYFLYADMPLNNKLFGISYEDLVSYIAGSPLSFMFLNNTSGGAVVDTYVNGIQHVLIYFGIIGLFLFLWFYYSLYKNNNILSKSLILSFICLMFVGNLYISHFMLISTAISYKQKYS